MRNLRLNLIYLSFFVQYINNIAIPIIWNTCGKLESGVLPFLIQLQIYPFVLKTYGPGFYEITRPVLLTVMQDKPI